jgi:hypothetical protein
VVNANSSPFIRTSNGFAGRAPTRPPAIQWSSSVSKVTKSAHGSVTAHPTSELTSTSTPPRISTPGMSPPSSRLSVTRPRTRSGSRVNSRSSEPEARPITGMAVDTAPLIRMPLSPALKAIRPESVSVSSSVMEPSISAEM